MARLEPNQRRSVIITSAVRIAKERGIWAVTHGSVAARCTVPTSAKTVYHYFKDKNALWSAVMDETDCPTLRDQAIELGWGDDI